MPQLKAQDWSKSPGVEPFPEALPAERAYTHGTALRRNANIVMPPKLA